MVAKLYRATGRDRANIEARIQALIDKQVSDAITPRDSRGQVQVHAQWPKDRVETRQDHAFLGCLLPAVDRDHPNILEYSANVYGGWMGRAKSKVQSVIHALTNTGTGFVDAYDIALALAQFVQTVHEHDCAIGDLSHEHLLIDGSTVLVTDCDRLHVEANGTYYAGDASHNRYTPPEGIGESLQAVQAADRFGLGVHIFQLVMGGYHPFQTTTPRTPATSLDDGITQRPFPYTGSSVSGPNPPAGAPAYAPLPVSLRVMFEQCLEEGQTDPAKRPEASQWVNVLTSLLEIGRFRSMRV
jgi:DNA-binding helix-hairpin-helix protein with protein kinase domain